MELKREASRSRPTTGLAAGRPLISVIVAVRNGAKTIERCIQSVEHQTYPCKQLVVIDGGSTDGTVDMIRKHQAHIDVWLSEPDAGLYNAWNKGLGLAQGEWISFLGCDDYYIDGAALERLAEAVDAAQPACRVVYGRTLLANAGGDVLRELGIPWEQARKKFFQTMNIPHPSTLHHRQIFRDHGNFDESFRIAGDYDLLLRELRDRDAFFLDRPITVMAEGGISTDAETNWLQIKEAWRARALNGVRGVPVVLMRHALGEVLVRTVATAFGARAGRTARSVLQRIRRRSG
jgi:glycosyltransferase involved in cell wall biosynthesis